MAKFILSVDDEIFRVLVNEAKTRGINVQNLLRAIVIADWVRSRVDNSRGVTGFGLPGSSGLRHPQDTSREHA